MSIHSYTKCRLHIIWNTLGSEKLLLTKKIRKDISKYLSDYSASKEIFMFCNYVNSNHVHILIDLPSNLSIEEIIKLYKGSSSYWINHNNLIKNKFRWGRGYSAFSVSESVLNKVIKYIKNQEEHHKTKNYTEEYKDFLRLTRISN